MELLRRHPENDRGNEVDIRDLTESMLRNGWLDGVGGMPWCIEDEASRSLGAMLMMGGATRCEAVYRAVKPDTAIRVYSVKLLLTRC